MHVACGAKIVVNRWTNTQTKNCNPCYTSHPGFMDDWMWPRFKCVVGVSSIVYGRHGGDLCILQEVLLFSHYLHQRYTFICCKIISLIFLVMCVFTILTFAISCRWALVLSFTSHKLCIVFSHPICPPIPTCFIKKPHHLNLILPLSLLVLPVSHQDKWKLFHSKSLILTIGEPTLYIMKWVT